MDDVVDIGSMRPDLAMSGHASLRCACRVVEVIFSHRCVMMTSVNFMEAMREGVRCMADKD